MKTIKKLGYIALLSISFLVISGCEKELEPVLYSDLTEDNFYNTKDDINNAVVALYSNFSTNWEVRDLGVDKLYAPLYNIDMKTYVTRSMITTDELYVNPTWDANLVNFTWGASTYIITGEGTMTEPTYPKIRFVARATEVIDKIPTVTSVPEIVRNQYLAEAKTLRAWLMYVLYDFFGPVNVRLDPATLNDTTINPRPSKEVYCAQIEKDLNEALATSSSSFPDYYNNDAGNWGRVSKGVARMLLLKLYMHNRQWDKAEAAAKAIMDMGYYELLPNYADVFNIYHNKEIIYALPANSASPNYWIAPLFPGEFASGKAGSNLVSTTVNGWYGFWMPWEHYAIFDTADKRTETIISSYTNVRGKVRNQASPGPMLGAIPMKYTKLPSGDVGPKFTMDWVVFRYAEVLLSLAEAINEQRGPEDAYQYVNQVRDRAFGDALHQWNNANIPTKEAFRDSILVERGRELYCEGVRRQDLIRHGKYVEYAIKRGATGAQPYDTLFPIPSSVIIEGRGIIKQNPGY